MSRIIAGICLASFLASTLLGEELFQYQHQFILKKDEIGSIFINRKEVRKKATKDNPNNEYLLRFRWTLFANNSLIVLLNYRGHPKQYVLEKKSPLESIIIPLLPDGEDVINSQVYAKIVFSDFNQSNKEAVFDIFIKDIGERILVEFKPIKK